MIMNSTSYRSIHNRNGDGSRKTTDAGHAGPDVRLYAIRLLAVAVVFSLLFSGFAIVQSYASDGSLQPAAQGEEVVIASPGDTLWDIASEVKAPGMDTRKAVFLIKERNGLSNASIKAGDYIIVPESVHGN